MKSEPSKNSFLHTCRTAITRHGHLWLRISITIVYVWFGSLKIAGISPAHDLVALTFPWFPADIFVPALGYWEVLIGLGVLFRRTLPVSIIMMLIHMIGTFFPMIMVTHLCFDTFPYRPSLIGQYIIKNIVFIVAALIILTGTERRE
ncbi:MAG: hypothetical protein U0264_15435 [Candidatus Kapaibacterium sp.]